MILKSCDSSLPLSPSLLTTSWLLANICVSPFSGYGDQGAGNVIPPDSTLLFDVELMEIRDSEPVEEDDIPSPPHYENVFAMIDKDNNKELSIGEVKEYLNEQQGFPSEDESNQETIVSEIFEHEDKDKDGVISFEEFGGPKHDEL